MGQPGFFDLDERYESLSKCGDPLEVLAKEIPWESFRYPIVLLAGGRSKGEKNRRVINRAAQALRMAANSLKNSNSYLGGFFRRLRPRVLWS